MSCDDSNKELEGLDKELLENLERLKELITSVEACDPSDYTPLLQCWGFSDANSLREELERVEDLVRELDQ